MTLPTSTRVTDPYETDGVQRDFEFDFPAFYNADTGHYGIEVRRLTELEYEVIDKSLYDIFLNDEDKSGYVRFHVAPMAGDNIYIAGDTTRSQQLNLINYGRYSAQSIEKAFDLIVALIQEFVSKVDEETRQRILSDQALRDFLLIKFNQFTAEVTTKIDKHIGDINGFMSSLIPMFVCIMRKEIAYYAETGMQDVIDEKLSGLSTQVADALDVLDESVSRINEATTATAIAARLFDTAAAGVHPVTGVPAGSYFNVRSSNVDSYVDEYQNVGGSAVATGKSYPSSALVADLKNNTAYFYPTVSQMVAATNLTDGVIVATKGYYNTSDDGGATYLISAVATDYSIPLANGLHAVFRDTFDIRKFGIVNNPTLNQTEKLLRMKNYVDDRVYELDFLGYSIQAPKYTTEMQVPSTGERYHKGLGFNRAHKIKNLTIVCDKTVQQKQGDCLIIYAPRKNPDQLEVFDLENVVLDPWNDNFQPYNQSTGHYDGARHAVLCHPAYGSSLPNWGTEVLNIDINLTNVTLKTPAYSYGVTTAALYVRRLRIRNLVGDYIAMLLNYHAFEVDVDKIAGRYDVAKLESGRNLARNLIHIEPEITEKPYYEYGVHDFKNCSATRKDTGEKHNLYSLIGVGYQGFTLKHLKISDSVGNIWTSVSRTDRARHTISKMTLDNCTSSHGFENNIAIESVELKNMDYKQDTAAYPITNAKVKSLVTQGVDFYSQIMGGANSDTTTLDTLKIQDATLYLNSYLYQNAGKPVTSAEFYNVRSLSTSSGVFDAPYSTLKVDGFSMIERTEGVNIVFRQRATGLANTSLNNLNIAKNLTQNLLFGPQIAVLSNSNFINRPTTSSLGTGGGLTEINVTPKPSNSVTFDPPSLAASGTAGDTTTTTITVAGVVMGDNINVAFTQYNAAVEISAQVSAANTVTVKFKNTSASAVDLPSGTLTAKKL